MLAWVEMTKFGNANNRNRNRKRDKNNEWPNPSCITIL